MEALHTKTLETTLRKDDEVGGLKVDMDMLLSGEYEKEPPPKTEVDDSCVKKHVRDHYGLKSVSEIQDALESKFKVEASRYTQSGAFSASDYWPKSRGDGVYKGAAHFQNMMEEIEKTGRSQTIKAIMNDKTLVTNLDRDFVLSYKIQQYEKQMKTGPEWINPFSGVEKKNFSRDVGTTTAFGCSHRPAHKDQARSPFNVPGMAVKGLDPETESIMHQAASPRPPPSVAKEQRRVSFSFGRRNRPSEHVVPDYSQVGPQHGNAPRYSAVDKSLHGAQFYAAEGHRLDNHSSHWNWGKVQTDRHDRGHPHNYPTDLELGSLKHRRNNLVNKRLHIAQTSRFDSYPYLKPQLLPSVPLSYLSSLDLVGKDMQNVAKNVFQPTSSAPQKPGSDGFDVFSRPSTDTASLTPAWTFPQEYRDKSMNIRHAFTISDNFKERRKREALTARPPTVKIRLNCEEMRRMERARLVAQAHTWRVRRHKALVASKTYREECEQRERDQLRRDAELVSWPTLKERIAKEKKTKQQLLWLSIIKAYTRVTKFKADVTAVREKEEELRDSHKASLSLGDRKVLEIKEKYKDICDFVTLQRSIRRIQNAMFRFLQRKRYNANLAQGKLLVDFFIWAKFSNQLMVSKNKILYSCKRIQRWWRRMEGMREARHKWLSQLWDHAFRMRKDRYVEMFNKLLGFGTRNALKTRAMPMISKHIKQQTLLSKYRKIQKMYVHMRNVRGIFGENCDRLDRSEIHKMRENRSKRFHWTLKRGLEPKHICNKWYHFCCLEEMHEVLKEAVHAAAEECLQHFHSSNKEDSLDLL